MEVQDNSLIILPSNKKDYILKIRKYYPLYNLKFMSFDEFIKLYYFDYNNEAIYNVMKKYNVKYEIAVSFINSLYYIEDVHIDNDKINFLKELKLFLESNNLLIKNSLFKEYLKKKNILVCGFNYLTKFQEKVLSNIKYEVVKEKKHIYGHNEILEFNNTSEEITYVATKIIDLIYDGININNIKIANVNDDYIKDIKRIFKLFNIPLDSQTYSLYNTNIALDFLNKLDINYIKNTYGYDEENLEIINEIITILNNYTWAHDYDDIKDMLIYDFKNKKIKKRFNNSIELINFNNYIPDNSDYVFLMNFNQNSIPLIYKDEDYLSDKLKNKIKLDTSYDLNLKERKAVIDKIKAIKNLIITYKINGYSGEEFISNLNEELNYQIKKDMNKRYNYSHKYNKIYLSNRLDELIKFGVKDDDLDLLYSNYNINYLTYDNRYNKIDKKSFINFINNHLILSYSSINNYYKCSFRYYLSNILKIEEFKETFYTIIGNIFHHILSICDNEEIDIHNEISLYIEQHQYHFNNKEKFFIDKLSKELIFIIETIKDFNKEILFNNTLYEKEIEIDIKNNVTFKGIVDKVIYKEIDGKTLVAIIDYKTGTLKTDLNNIAYGIDMQLPIYLYLVNHLFNQNTLFVGFYLEKILNNDYSMEDKKESLKLRGYTNKEIFNTFDKNSEDSKIIKDKKKIIDTNRINKIITLVEQKIKEASLDILNANFDINPKIIKGKNIGCEYCPFKDICYVNPKDYTYLKEYKDLTFLEGDINANVD